MFPHTQRVDLFPCCVDIHGIVSSHVVTVALLSRKSASKSFIPVSISPKDMGLSEEKEQPTYANIRDYVQKTHGMKVSSLYEAEVNKLEQLMNKCDELQKKELMKAIEDSNRSFDEIMQFLQGDASAEGSEGVES